MADGIEQIESRLAAYIDGELADADRAEIEKYLAANPSHRQLITELKLQKSRIASLPRESAPVEILDHLQSHLERQALLDNVEDGADSMRINRWPQWTAVAAMLLLTVGLGALVFSVLPGGALNHETVAIAPPSIQNLPSAPSLDAKETEIESRDAVASSADRRDTSDESLAKSAAKPHLSKAGTDALDEHTKLNDAMVLEPPAAPGAGFADARQTNVALNNGSAIVVSTDDPLITQNLLAGYLGQNNYEYAPVQAEVAQASVAAAQSNASAQAEAKLQAGAPNDQQLTQTQSAELQFGSSQQAIGSIVERVSAKDNTVVAGEKYLVVRNLTPADAERINTIINSQRGARQQARVYFNRDLYPENAQPGQQHAANQAESIAEQQPQRLEQLEPTTLPSTDADKNKSDAEFRRERAAKGGYGQKQEGQVVPPSPAGDFPNQATGAQQQADVSPAPAAEQDLAARTDVLIVLRNDPTLDAAPATQPSTQPAELSTTQPSTQPATQPSEQVAPIVPLNAEPATQPAP